MIKIIRLLVVCILLASASFVVMANDKAWLVGDWILTFDPDGATKDRLTFESDGRFITTQVSTGKQYKGIYLVRPKAIQVKLARNGKIFMSFYLKYDEEKDRLYFTSSKTGATSYYTKLK